jgi:hypothetical protein
MRISPDSDKSYLSGRLRVSDKVAAIVGQYAMEKWQKALLLKDTLDRGLPGWRVILDEGTLDIAATAEGGQRKVQFRNAGTNNFMDEIYNFGSPRAPSILIYGRSSRLVQGARIDGDKPQWFLWSARLKKGSLGRLDHYPHIITAELLAQCADIPAV